MADFHRREECEKTRVSIIPPQHREVERVIHLRHVAVSQVSNRGKMFRRKLAAAFTDENQAYAPSIPMALGASRTVRLCHLDAQSKPLSQAALMTTHTGALSEAHRVASLSTRTQRRPLGGTCDQYMLQHLVFLAKKQDLRTPYAPPDCQR